MADKITQIYQGEFEDFTWAGFGSGSGTNLAALAQEVKPPALIFCDRPSADLLDQEKRPELKDTPRIILNGYKDCGSYKALDKITIPESKQAALDEYIAKCKVFNEHILDELRKFEKKSGKRLDLIVLGGYMRFVMDPLLEEFTDRIINVHPSCLLYNPRVKGKRDFIGEDAVYEAIKIKQWTTHSSVIIVDEGEDHGEILAQGPKVPVWEEIRQPEFKEADEKLIRKYAKIHQDRQKEVSDWPAFVWTLEMIANSRLALGSEKVHYNEWRRVYWKNNSEWLDKLPYGGFSTPHKEIKLAA
ncbi:MAG: formyltransferase family protein [archaeon]